MSDASMNSETLVTIATFNEPMEANLARTALEFAGIDACLNGEMANSMVPVAFTAQLQVKAADEAEARSVLTQMEDAPESLESVTEAETAGEAS